MLEYLEEQPLPPPNHSPSAESAYKEQMNYFKNHSLDHLDYWDRLILIVSTSLKDRRWLDREATHVEIAELYLKRIALN